MGFSAHGRTIMSSPQSKLGAGRGVCVCVCVGVCVCDLALLRGSIGSMVVCYWRGDGDHAHGSVLLEG